MEGWRGRSLFFAIGAAFCHPLCTLCSLLQLCGQNDPLQAGLLCLLIFCNLLWMQHPTCTVQQQI